MGVFFSKSLFFINEKILNVLAKVLSPNMRSTPVMRETAFKLLFLDPAEDSLINYSFNFLMRKLEIYLCNHSLVNITFYMLVYMLEILQKSLKPMELFLSVSLVSSFH